MNTANGARPPEPGSTPVSRKDRFLGCLLGLAIGDALGMPVEGWDRQRIAETHGWIDRYLPRTDDAGQIVVAAGEFTDDTELALCQVEALITAGGFVDPEAVGMRLLRLMQSESERFLDATTRAAIARMEETLSFQDGVPGDGVPGAAVAAQIAPVGLMHALSRLNAELFTREVLRAGLITHSHPESLNGALAMAYAIWLLAAEDVPPELLIPEVASFIDEDSVARRLRLAGELVGRGGDRERDLANLQQIGTSGHVAEAVAAAMYSFVTHNDDFTATVETAVNAGGDTDTIGAMAGALAGTHLGAPAIPPELVDGLEGRMYILVAGPGLYRAAQRRAGQFLRLHRRQ